jgi:hypothetical protein
MNSDQPQASRLKPQAALASYLSPETSSVLALSLRPLTTNLQPSWPQTSHLEPHSSDLKRLGLKPLLATADKLVETLDGISEPGLVPCSPPFVMGRMFRPRRKRLGAIASIPKAWTHLSDMMVQGCRFC